MLSTHRCIGQAIAKGTDLKRLTAGLFAKSTSYAGGRAGEMAFQAREICFLASGVVGNVLSIATGFGLAMKKRP